MKTLSRSISKRDPNLYPVRGPVSRPRGQEIVPAVSDYHSLGWSGKRRQLPYILPTAVVVVHNALIEAVIVSVVVVWSPYRAWIAVRWPFPFLAGAWTSIDVPILYIRLKLFRPMESSSREIGVVPARCPPEG